MDDNPAAVRAVIDTNVFVSGTIIPHGPSAAILNAWQQQRFSLLMSAWQRAEIARTLMLPRISRRYHVGEERLAGTLLLIDTMTVVVEPLTMLPVTVRDRNDDPILGMALAGKATHLVTGDRDLLVLADHPAMGALHLVTPRIFAAML